MNKFYLLILLFLAGCGNQPIKEVKVEVWTPPKFDMPDRPILRTNKNAKTDGEVVRNEELNSLDLENYAAQLEAIVSKIKGVK